MFGSLGGTELLAILALALILFGPRRLPEIGRTLAKGLNEFRKATNDFKTSLEREVDMEEMRDVRRQVNDTVAQARSLARGSILDAAPPPMRTQASTETAASPAAAAELPVAHDADKAESGESTVPATAPPAADPPAASDPDGPNSTRD